MLKQDNMTHVGWPRFSIKIKKEKQDIDPCIDQS